MNFQRDCCFSEGARKNRKSTFASSFLKLSHFIWAVFKQTCTDLRWHAFNNSSQMAVISFTIYYKSSQIHFYTAQFHRAPSNCTVILFLSVLTIKRKSRVWSFYTSLAHKPHHVLNIIQLACAKKLWTTSINHSNGGKKLLVTVTFKWKKTIEL